MLYVYLNMIKILHIIQTLNPEYGGPATSLIDNSLMLSKKGFKVDILTYDTKNQIKNLRKDKIKILNQGPSLGKYTFSLKVFFWILRNKNNYDIFIVHGIWHFSTLLARILLKKRYFVFLHGGLDSYFKSEIIKLIKKKLYWHLIEKKNLIHSKGLLLTNNFESKQIKNTFVNTKDIKKKNVGFGILKPKINKILCKKLFYKKFPYLKKKKYFLFLGRFHPKKGCFVLLDAVNKLKKKNIEINILMVGPNSIYKKKLKKYCRQIGLQDNFFWHNTLTGNLKWGSILCSEGMVLSSHGENFGVSIVESLCCSKPVLTTHKVGVSPEIINYKAGFVSKDNAKDFSSILLKYLKLRNNKLNILSNNALKCFEKSFDLDVKINRLSLFLKKSLH